MKKKKKFFSFSLYFWLAFVVLIAFLFFINRAVIAKTISKIKESPSFSKPETVQNDVKEVLENSRTTESKNLRHDEKDFIQDGEKTHSHSEDEQSGAEKPLDIVESSSLKDLNLEGVEKQAKEETEEKTSNTTESPPAKERALITNSKNETRAIEVYFASVNDNGLVTREKCVRSVTRSLSPMVDSLNALLKGPTKEEAKQGIRSFIPADTRLLSASIKDETAVINLSDDFQFNRYGVEGYNIQLQQIVFTVCSFPTVKSVQFLIEGQKRDFLGSEGVWIGSPFTVNSF